MSDDARTVPAHPTTAVYLIIAALLTGLTAMEVTVFYLHALRPVLLPLLLLLSAAKFTLVVLFYMHARFDRWAYGAVFVTEIFFAVALVLSLVLLMTTFYASG